MARPGSTLPQPVFSEDLPTADPSTFTTPHPSDNAQYAALGDLAKKQLVPITPSRAAPGDLFALADAYGAVHGPDIVQGIAKAGQIVFHALGDSGATSEGKKYDDELTVADRLTADCNVKQPEERPAFLYHLGDVVYNFGESKYYFDQFYEPFRMYPRPIFALAGNHDSFVVPGTPPGQEPLTTFERNFCNPQITITPEAGSLHRTAMTQPGVYFTLDAPFVRIIGLFSNSLENPGHISSEGGKFPLSDIQLDFLKAQLANAANYQGALLIAVHHPPFSYYPKPAKPSPDGHPNASTDMLRDIDTLCAAAGVYPHAVLCAHAHNYQRYTRTLSFKGKTREVPFVLCGCGGHNTLPLVSGMRGSPQPPQPKDRTDVSYMDIKPAVTAKKLVLAHSDSSHFGYLRVTATSSELTIAFVPTTPGGKPDTVTVELASGTLK